MPRPKTSARAWAESVAVQALTFLTQEPERLGSFLALSGLGPDSIRAAASQPDFLAGVLDHIAGDERLLLDFAAGTGLSPQDIEKAQAMLAGERWQPGMP
jgi:hypothetical protein